ncbi:hypothetical protein ACQR35_02100 [Pseudarthrobacter sp. J1738]
MGFLIFLVVVVVAVGGYFYIKRNFASEIDRAKRINRANKRGE